MGTGTPGREATILSSTPTEASDGLERVLPRRSRSPGWPVSLFGWAAVSSSRPCESGTGVARRGGQGRAQARPQGLSLTAPSTAPALGVVGTREGSRPSRRRRGGAAVPSNTANFRRPLKQRQPGPLPWSRSVRRTQSRSVSAVQPILAAIDEIAAHCDACSP